MGDPQNFDVRHATKEDVPTLVTLWTEIMDERVIMDARVRITPEAPQLWQSQLLSWLSMDDAQVWVADKKGKLIGYLVAMVQERPIYYYQQRYGYIVDLGVDGHAHQGGVGTRLFDKCKAWFLAQGCELIEIPVMRLHPMAQAFWRAKGATQFMDNFWYRLR